MGRVAGEGGPALRPLLERLAVAQYPVLDAGRVGRGDELGEWMLQWLEGRVSLRPPQARPLADRLGAAQVGGEALRTRVEALVA